MVPMPDKKERNQSSSIPVTAISPAFVYHMNLTSQEAMEHPACSDRKRCTLGHQFRLHHLSSCQFTMACISLEGNICGDYGIKAGMPEVKPKVKFCHGGELRTIVTLNSSDESAHTAGIYLWQMAGGSDYR